MTADIVKFKPSKRIGITTERGATIMILPVVRIERPQDLAHSMVRRPKRRAIPITTIGRQR